MRRGLSPAGRGAGSPSSPRGGRYRRGLSPSPEDDHDEGDSPVAPADAETLPALDPPISPKELARNNFQPHHLDTYDFARDEITGGLYAFDAIGPIAIDDDGEIHRIDPDRIAGYHRAAQKARRTTVVPAQAEPQGGGEAFPSSPRGGRHRRGLSPSPEDDHDEDDSPVAPADAETQRGGEAFPSSPRGGRYRRGLSPSPEDDQDEGDSSPSTEDDQDEGDSPAEQPSPSQPKTRNQKPKTLPRPRRRNRTHARRAGNTRPHPARRPGTRAPSRSPPA